MEIIFVVCVLELRCVSASSFRILNMSTNKRIVYIYSACLVFGLMFVCLAVSFLLTCLSACLFMYVSICLLFACMTVCLPTCLPAYLPICLLAFLPTCLPAYLPTCLPACLHTCFPVCLSSSVFKEKIKEAAYPPTEGVYERSGSFRLTKVGVATITRVTRDKVMAVR